MKAVVWAPEARKKKGRGARIFQAYVREARVSRLATTEPRIHRFVQPIAPLLLA
jgi:hypothetical protein